MIIYAKNKGLNMDESKKYEENDFSFETPSTWTDGLFQTTYLQFMKEEFEKSEDEDEWLII